MEEIRFDSKIMYRVFWIEKNVIGVKEALFESREDAEDFKDMMELLRPDCDVHINKWSWKVLVEK